MSLAENDPAEFTASGEVVTDRSRAARVRLALHRSSFEALQRIGCEVVDGVVGLDGVVQSFHLKQVAQTIVQHVPGVKGVENLVHVDDQAFEGQAARRPK